ncbi:MAG: PAS domain-containing protein [Sideroxyarcus sp.]|nr:PAS domain-containing protein [Sideroxyarcus sp.]
MPLIRPDNNVPIPALLKRFALIYLPIVLVVSIVLLWSFQFEEQRRVEKIEGHENIQIEVAKGLATRDLAEVDTDLRILANLDDLRQYLDSGNPAQRGELENIFLVLARETRRYDQVRYFDASGQEQIRINYNDGKPAIVPRGQLQNKKGRYYFDDTLKLNRGEIFVSPLDLNIEQGSLEIPHKPMIRFGTPVFDSTGRKQGIIMLNYLGGELLRHFYEMTLEDPKESHHSHMLLNRDGYWLSSTTREDEWGFMLGNKERTFGHDFPEEWRAISAAEQGSLRTDRGLFVYTTIHPLLSAQHSSTGSPLANAPSQQEVKVHEYTWKIVSFVPHADLSGAAFYNQNGGRITLAIAYLLLALAAWIIALATLNRKQAEGRLRESEMRLSMTIASAELATWDWNIKTGHDIFNARWAEMRGYRLEEIEPQVSAWEKGVNPDDLAAMGATLEEHFKGHTPFFQAEYRVRTKSGAWIWVLDRGTVLERDAEGNPLRMAGIEIDISERKQAQNDLLEAKRALQEFFDLVPDMVCIASATDGRFRQVNKIWETILGFTTDELIGKPFIDFIHPDDVAATLAEVEKQLTGQSTLNFINRYRNKDGSYKWLEWVAMPAGENKLLYAAARDISERKLAEQKLKNAFQELEKTQDASLNIMADLDREVEERKQAEAEVLNLNAGLEEKVIARTAQLEQAKLELEQANRGKDEFLAAISHELKTPLNHILGFAELLKEGLAGELSAEQKGMAQDIFAAGSRQLALVNALIELARLQTGKVELRTEAQDPARLLGEIAARHKAKARAAGLAFTVEVAQGLGEMPLDREVVTRLLDQLLANACKFTPSGGTVSLAARRVPRAEVTAPVRVEAGEYLELAVADNGPGIAPEILPRLFQSFVQGEGGLARSHGGTGIGLVLVRLLAELHGGASGVESEPGAGAKFLVWLPCGAADVEEGS